MQKTAGRGLPPRVPWRVMGRLGPAPFGQAGWGLVEVLVSLALACLGLLALAASSAAALRYSQWAHYQATANVLASDLSERIRANPDGHAYYSYVSSFAAQQAQQALPDPPVHCLGYSAPACNAAAMARHDLADWRLHVRARLPGGAIYLQPRAPAGAFALWIAWRDPALPGDGATASVLPGCAQGLDVQSLPGVRCSYFPIHP